MIVHIGVRCSADQYKYSFRNGNRREKHRIWTFWSSKSLCSVRSACSRLAKRYEQPVTGTLCFSSPTVSESVVAPIISTRYLTQGTFLQNWTDYHGSLGNSSAIDSFSCILRPNEPCIASWLIPLPYKNIVPETPGVLFLQCVFSMKKWQYKFIRIF